MPTAAGANVLENRMDVPMVREFVLDLRKIPRLASDLSVSESCDYVPPSLPLLKPSERRTLLAIFLALLVQRSAPEVEREFVETIFDPTVGRIFSKETAVTGKTAPS